MRGQRAIDQIQPQPKRLPRWLPPVLLVVSWLVLLTLLGFQPPLLDIDSGPYVSMAHHLRAEGAAVSSFGFAGGFEQLPSPPGFAPPGFPALLAFGSTLSPTAEAPADSWQLAGRTTLFACLLAAQLFTFLVLERALGDRAYALGASILLIWNPAFSLWATLVLTELPFLTCLLAAIAAGIAVLTLPPGAPSKLPRRLAWAALVSASALLPLVRYLGVFFVPVFIVAFLLVHHEKRSKHATRLALYSLLSYLPLALWLWCVYAAGSSIFPDRPPSQLSLPAAVGDAAQALGGWLSLWVLGGLMVLAWRNWRESPALPHDSLTRGSTPAGRTNKRSGAERGDAQLGRRPRAEDSSASRAALYLLTGCLLGYLGLLMFLRTRSAYYPLNELGIRYLAPAWPPAALLVAVLFHRWVWRSSGGRMGAGRPRPRWLTAAVLAGALLQLAWYAHAHLEREATPLFPTFTPTYQALLERAAPEDGVLMTFGQAYAIDRPDARVVGIPSRLDFNYELDVPALAREHDLRWLVILAVPGGEEMYGDWYSRWLQKPPPELPLAGAWRMSRPDGSTDGVIFRLAFD